MSTTPARIVRNTVTNSLSFAFLFVSNLFLLPYIVHGLGDIYYGSIWVIIGALTAYMGLIDLGSGTSFVKFVSEFHTKKDDTSLLEVVNTGTAVYLLVGAVLLAVTWIAGGTILWLVGVPEAIMDDALFVLRMGMIVFIIANVASPLTSVLVGIQRMDINSFVAIGTQTLTIVGTVVVLSSGYGIRGLILINLVAVLFNAGCLGWFAFRHVPGLRFGLRFCKLSMARRFLSYGANLQVSKLAQILLFQTDRILCVRLFGGVTATYYDIGARLTNTGRSVAFLSVSALIPAVAQLDALQYREKILTLYRRSSKYIGVLATYMFLFIGVFAPQIIRVWFWDERYLASVNIVRILAFGYFFNIVTGAASPMTAGVGKTDLDRRYGIFTSLFNIVAAVGLAFALGPQGIALGTALSLVLGALYFLHMFHSYINVSSADIARLLGRPMLAGVMAGVVALVVSLWLPEFTDSRMLQGVSLAGLLAIYSGAFVGFLVALRVFDSYDLDMFRSITGKIT